MVASEVGEQDGVEGQTVHAVRAGSERGDFHNDMGHARFGHSEKMAVKFAAFRRGVDGIEMIFPIFYPIGTDIACGNAAAIEQLAQSQTIVAFLGKQLFRSLSI